MIAHIFKMIWNRKKSNALIIAEVAIAFMVIFALSVLAIRNFNLSQIPLGFDYDNMWRVEVSNAASWDPAKDQPTIMQILLSLEQESEIESVSLMSSPTFKNWVWSTSYDLDGQEIAFMANRINDGAAESFGMELQAGRWFGPQDDGQNYLPVLVSQLFVDKYFPGQDIIGKNIASDENRESTEMRVVGVFKAFRQLGEFSRLRPYVFHRINLNEPHRRPLSGIELKLKPDTKIIYEEKLLKLLKGIAPQWDYDIKTWSSQRETMMRETLLPMIVLSIVGCFLIIMVAMGLFGVLWQNVTSRTHEIGLRRALGATANQIQNQIVGELLLVSLLGIAFAFIILVQLPMLGVFVELDWPLFFKSLIVATVFMLTLAALCAYYPGKVATNYAPAEALHYE